MYSLKDKKVMHKFKNNDLISEEYQKDIKIIYEDTPEKNRCV